MDKEKLGRLQLWGIYAVLLISLWISKSYFIFWFSLGAVKYSSATILGILSFIIEKLLTQKLDLKPILFSIAAAIIIFIPPTLSEKDAILRGIGVPQGYYKEDYGHYTDIIFGPVREARELAYPEGYGAKNILSELKNSLEKDGWVFSDKTNYDDLYKSSTVYGSKGGINIRVEASDCFPGSEALCRAGGLGIGDNDTRALLAITIL